MITTIDACYHKLLQNPDDWETRLVLADFYEELGEDKLAFGQRWQVKNKRFALNYSNPPNKDAEWQWYFWDDGHRDVFDPNDLKLPVFTKVVGFTGAGWEDYDSQPEADEALATWLHEAGVPE